MPAYYNDNDPRSVAWLHELMKAGLIPDGEIDDRSITDAVRQDGGMGRPSGASAPTGSSGESQLNPFFALWLMGYPVEWGYCGVRAMQSYRK